MKSSPHTLFGSMYKIVNEKQEINSEIEVIVDFLLLPIPPSPTD